MYKMFFDNIDMCASKFDSLILKLACPVRYPKRPFNYITGDIDEQLSNCYGFSFRLMGGTKQCQMGFCLHGIFTFLRVTDGAL